MGHAKPFSQIDNARFTRFSNKVGDGLDIILRDFDGVIAAQPLKCFGMN